MPFRHRGGQVTIIPPNTKHRVEYWVNREETKVIYTWFNAVGGTARIVEWDYSDRLENSDDALNRLRDLVGADRKISSFAGMGVGRVQEQIERRDIDFNQNIFDVALQKTHQMYPHLSRNS